MAVAARERYYRSARWLQENRFPWIRDLSVLERALVGRALPEDLAYLIDPTDAPESFNPVLFPPDPRLACLVFGEVFGKSDTAIFLAWKDYQSILEHGGTYSPAVVRGMFRQRREVWKRMRLEGRTWAEIMRAHYQWQRAILGLPVGVEPI